VENGKRGKRKRGESFARGPSENKEVRDPPEEEGGGNGKTPSVLQTVLPTSRGALKSCKRKREAGLFY